MPAAMAGPLASPRSLCRRRQSASNWRSWRSWVGFRWLRQVVVAGRTGPAAFFPASAPRRAPATTSAAARAGGPVCRPMCGPVCRLVGGPVGGPVCGSVRRSACFCNYKITRPELIRGGAAPSACGGAAAARGMARWMTAVAGNTNQIAGRLAAGGSELTLRRALQRPPRSSWVVTRPRPWRRPGLGTRTHATGRCPRSTVAAPRVPSPARPPSPDLAAAPVVGGQPEDVRVWPSGRVRTPPGSRSSGLAASKPCCTKPGLWGRAGRGA